MSRTPVQHRSKEKKRKIVVAGMKLFSEKGFHGTGITEIAQQAEVAVGSFYSYFRDKSDLLDQVTESYAQSIIRGVYGNLYENSKKINNGEKLTRYLVNAARQAHSLSTELHREMLALKNRNPKMAELDKAIVDTFTAETQKILDNFDKTKVTDHKISAGLITGAIEETMHRCLIEKQETDVDKAFNELVQMCAGYLFHE
ncbi:TetR/AcrR family transcriptional regulator [Maridesulfovibrio zosterae]|uniref:TetR/AcrR family transcriptional regulator n=1 Tax=Maridesulfovibrio zosterae TaxID=82171 RepID=UPI00040277B3|nr:TetR/AcrR family transcriptional regulator [Maridesulfovibrio zosterae]